MVGDTTEDSDANDDKFLFIVATLQHVFTHRLADKFHHSSLCSSGNDPRTCNEQSLKPAVMTVTLAVDSIVCDYFITYSLCNYTPIFKTDCFNLFPLENAMSKTAKFMLVLN